MCGQQFHIHIPSIIFNYKEFKVFTLLCTANEYQINIVFNSFCLTNFVLTQIFEKIVPVRKYNALGSSFNKYGEYIAHTEVINNKNIIGIKGLTASLKVLICPVFCLYDIYML